LDCCRNGGIVTVGAGENAVDAGKPLIVDVAGWTIGIIAFAEHEFNAAAEDRCGANLFDVYESFEQIKLLRTQCDYLVALYHGGIEYYVYPSPLLQKKCRKMVESGADIVLCQHSHCVGTAENYNGGTILYGQGNTIFGYRQNSPDWNEGLIVRISLSENSQPKATVEYLPILADNAGIDLMPLDKAGTFLETFFKRSQNITDKNFVNVSWRRFCESKQAHYLPLLLGLGRILNYTNRKLKNRIVRLFFSKRRMRITMNLIRCESHNEVIQTILDKYVTEKTDVD
jgi:poly-gamma-glutamate synthesis protein (capsule biosynthesis protein)